MRVKPCLNGFQSFCMAEGLTAKEVAELLGISKYTVYSYYRGDRLPSRRVVKRFEEVFGVDASEVFDYEPEYMKDKD